MGSCFLKVRAAFWSAHARWHKCNIMWLSPCTAGNACDFMCALVSLPDQWPGSLVWERDCMFTYVQGQKMTSYATDSSHAVNSFVNFKLWRHWVVIELCTVVSINFVLKLQSLFEPFLIYKRSGLDKEKRITKMALRYQTLLCFKLAVFCILLCPDPTCEERHSCQLSGNGNNSILKVVSLNSCHLLVDYYYYYYFIHPTG